MPPWGQLYLPLLDDGNAVFRVVVPVAASEISLRAGPGESDTRESVSRLRVLEVAFRRRDVARPPPSASDVQRHVTVANVDVACRTALVRRRSEIEGEHPRGA